MSVYRDLPIIRSKCVEIYVGLFGPALTYHTSGYDGGNARLVVSLILLEFYFTLPWCHKTNPRHEFYSEYGFYTATEPDRIVFRWGDFYKVLYMPWNRVCIRMRPVDMDGVVIGGDLLNDSDFVNDCCVRKDCLHGYGFSYWVSKKTLRPNGLKRLGWFDKDIYGVFVEFDSSLNGTKSLRFPIPNDIYKMDNLIRDHIELHILARVHPDY